jgi:gamma-glutamylcyclotransferase (GGCT)/AIG2-like uncharacterized protein YtfP
MGANGLIFVYGTLMRGGKHHRELAAHKVRFVGEGKIKGRLFRIKGESYPGAAPVASRAYIRGEVYELTNPEKTLEKLDRFEGTDERLFVRKLVNVWLGREKFRAWVYFYAGRKNRAARIPGGRFRVRAAARRKSGKG